MSRYQLIRESARTARKPHKCIWCGWSIEAGAKYVNEVSLFDGMQNHHWHPECYHGREFGDDCDGEFIPYENERPAESAQQLVSSTLCASRMLA